MELPSSRAVSIPMTLSLCAKLQAVGGADSILVEIFWKLSGTRPAATRDSAEFRLVWESPGRAPIGASDQIPQVKQLSSRVRRTRVSHSDLLRSGPVPAQQRPCPRGLVVGVSRGKTQQRSLPPSHLSRQVWAIGQPLWLHSDWIPLDSVFVCFSHQSPGAATRQWLVQTRARMGVPRIPLI